MTCAVMLAVAMLPGGGPALAVVAQAAAAETDAGPLVDLVCRLEVARNGWDSCRCKRLREWSLPPAAGFPSPLARRARPRLLRHRRRPRRADLRPDGEPPHSHHLLRGPRIGEPQDRALTHPHRKRDSHRPRLRIVRRRPPGWDRAGGTLRTSALEK